jgi:hypothetical protein
VPLLQQIVRDARADQISAELARRGIPARVQVHVLVELSPNIEPPMAAIA